jgi:hypothetical protein
MDYSKLTKQELIEQLEKSISLEKYNKLEAVNKIKSGAASEMAAKVEILELQLQEAQNQNQVTMQNAERAIQNLQNDLKYINTILQNQYKLTNLLNNKRTEDGKFASEIIEIYHGSVFSTEQNEEK